MRRAGAWAVLVALAAGLGGLGFVSWPVAAPIVAEKLAPRSGGPPPLRLAAAGAATFRAFPWPSVRVTDVRLELNGGAIVLTAPQGRMDLALADLFAGRLAPVRARFTTPIVTLDVDRLPASGPSDWLDTAAGAFAPLDGVSLIDGVLRVVSRKRAFDQVVENLSGTVAGLAPGARLRVDLSATWRGAPFAVSALIADPRLAARGKASAMNFTVASPVAALSFKGALAGSAVPGLAGDLSLSVPSLRAFARLIGGHALPILPGDDVSIAGRLAASPNEAQFADATVTSAGQRLQGALHVEAGGARPQLSGTLDADRLAVGPLAGLADLAIDAGGGWSARPFGLAPPTNFDLDLRLSAGRLDVFGHELANAALSLILKDGVLAASLIDAAAYGGRLEGEAKIGCRGRDLDFKARGRLADADFGAALSDFGRPGLNGKGTAEFALETDGDSPAAAIARLSGSASIRLKEGAVADVNLEELLRRSQRRRIDLARDLRGGGAAFDRLGLDLTLSRGVVQVANGELAAQGVTGDLEGRIDLRERTWALRFSAMQTDSSGGESPDAAHLVVDLGGPWSEPTVRVSGDKAEEGTTLNQ